MKVKHVFMIAAVMLALIAAPVSAANEAILGYEVPESYTITIPATLAFNVENPITVKGSIVGTTCLNVYVDSENDWVVENGEDSVGYSMTVDDESITTSGETGAVAILTGLSSDEVAGNGKESNLRFTLSGEATKAGKYTDKLTFSIEAIGSAATLKEILATGGKVTINADIHNSENDIDTQLLADKENTEINLGSSKITQTAEYTDGISLINQNCVGLLVTGEGVTLNADPDGGITSEDLYAIYVLNGGSLEINGGTYKGHTTAVQVNSGGSVTINGGFFEAEADDYRYTLNLIDDSGSSIIVYGGTFVNFNPADNAAENPPVNFVAPGYTVIAEEQLNGDIWYTVVAESTSP